MPDRESDEFQRIAGAFVHDFNNLYQTTLGNLDLLSRRIRDPAAAELVEETIISVERAVELTERLNLIGNKHPERFQRVAIDDAITAAAGELRERLRDRREITVRAGARGAACRLFPGQLERALSALILQGPGALSRGPVSIESGLSESAGGDGVLTPGSYVRITVSAAGAGPTAPSGLPVRDAGVGFPLIRMFAAQLGGACRMDQDSGGGTRVELFLPAEPE